MASDPRESVLVVEDEKDLARLISFNLGEAGFEVATCHTAADGLKAAEERPPVVVVLDLMLPDLPGTEVLRRLRAHPTLADVGVLILTARGDEYDRVVGFELGADDYVVKPCSMRELVLRVRALCRRVGERQSAAQKKDEGTRLRWRGLEVDPVRHRVYIDGAEVKLRPLEYKLITLLLENPGRVYSRAELLDEVWGITADVNTRTVDTHVRRLRERLGPYESAVETVVGFGYRLREP